MISDCPEQNEMIRGRKCWEMNLYSSHGDILSMKISIDLDDTDGPSGGSIHHMRFSGNVSHGWNSFHSPRGDTQYEWNPLVIEGCCFALCGAWITPFFISWHFGIPGTGT
jgi:hypothetical protein